MSIVAIAAVLLWSVVIARIPTLTKQLTQRLLWAALAALATAVTLEVDAVTTALDGLSGLSANLSHLVKHAMVVIAAGLASEVVRGLVLPTDAAARGRLLRAAVAVVSLALLVALFAITPVHVQPLSGLTTVAVGEPTLLAYWVVYLSAVGYTLIGIGRLALCSVTTFPAGSVRTSMAWISVGSAVGLAYCGHKGTYLTAAILTDRPWSTSAMETVQQSRLAATVMILVIGVLWPTFTQLPIIRHLRAYRAHRRLHDLWLDYYQAEPGIALNPPFIERHNTTRLRDIELDLYRRVIEIRDGMLAVSHFAAPHTRELAISHARNERHDDAVLVGEAAWLELARRARLRGSPPHHEPVPTPTGGADLATEITVLTRIARARTPIHRIASQIETQATTSP